MAKKQSILIADDDPQALAILQQIMLSQGYEVFTASEGSSALAQVESKKPDLIILDNYMPGMSGSEICSKLGIEPEGLEPLLDMAHRKLRNELTRT